MGAERLVRSLLGAGVALTLVVVPAAMAQDRLPRLPPDKLSDAQKKAIEEFKAARGADVSGPFVPLLRSPEVMNRARAMGDYLRFKSTLPPKLSEFVIIITAREWTQNYEWDAHARLALEAGVSADTVNAIAAGRRPDRMTDDETLLYELTTELHHHKSVTDETYGRVVKRFGEQGVIDTIGITGYYTLLAMVLNTARTPVPAGRTPALQPFAK
jgi:4-carboxymuconolactone decarboxylase